MSYDVLIGKSSFNIHECGLEEELLQYWEDINLEARRKKLHENASPFILHDGPPYANGPLHMGHAENKIWKDCLNKVFWSLGYSTPYILGWDAHGLPIENAVEKELKNAGIDKKTLSRQEFWDKCLEFASYWVEEQKKGFKKLGVFADYNAAYVTFLEDESLGIINCIHSFVAEDLLVQKYRPVLWSYVEKTALAYAEVEYKDRISHAIYFPFQLVEVSDPVLQDVKLLIWTTTPWTLPANCAVAYNQNFTYVIFSNKNEKYCVAKPLFESVKALFDECEIIEFVQGTVFLGCVVKHCIKEFDNFNRKLLHGDHVDLERGTGFVHTAPAHGEDDYELGEKHDLPIEDLLDEYGSYLSSVPLVGGMHVKEADLFIVQCLKDRGLCVNHQEFTHSYPHSWRSKAPLIYRLTKQWFLNMSILKEKALAVCNHQYLRWFPKEGKNRFISMLGNREDWCISRQRIWGVPLSIFYNKNTGKVLKNSDFLQKSREKLKQIGVKNWSQLSVSDIDPSYQNDEWERVDDIVDIWFESGATQHFVLKGKGLFPADVYLEGSDQHRGWFQSSLLISAWSNGQAPWKNLLTHGFCLDSRKQKMSKSLGNVLSPLSWNIDVLRVFFSSLDLSSDISLSESSIQAANTIVARFKKTVNFLLGHLAISTALESVPYSDLPALEKWILHRLYELDDLFLNITKSFYLNHFINALYEFCDQDLSSFYFDICKDSLYCEKGNSFSRRSIISVSRILTPILIKYLSIFMPYSMEKAWLCYVEENNSDLPDKDSVHLQERAEIPLCYQNFQIKEYVEKLREIKRNVNAKIELLRESKVIKVSHEISVKLSANLLQPFAHEKAILSDLKRVLIVSNVEPGEVFEVVPYVGIKCQRCKFVFPSVVESELCQRCFSVLHAK